MYLNDGGMPATPDPIPVAAQRGAGNWLARRVLRYIHKGRLTIILPSGEAIAQTGEMPGHDATLILHHPRAIRRLLTRGDMGFFDGYVAGDWSSPDLVALLTLLADNVERLQQTIDGLAVVRLAKRLRHLVRRNSKRGSRRNISFHYDLGNDFYRLWLDESMTYSSACAVQPGQTLEDAQQAKLDAIAGMLDLHGSETVLEIGCGWGALAAHLAPLSASVTGVTLSREQLAVARDRCATAGLSNVDLRLQDYRDVPERFDRIVSIEMIEAVGEAYWPVYFDTLRARLAPGGTAVLQIITMREDLFDSYRTRSDFIQQHVFPGGMLLSHGVIEQQAQRVGLTLDGITTFREGYAATLAEWRRRFTGAADEVAKLGFDRDFCRLWTYYLSYCEAGFRTGTIDVGLYILKG
ncbi:class I SAM-dependent methyltransferase [Sphingomonas sp. 28-62-20]|uniref:class I SAM-dependent methyltransferase n=1 Tax=Sphingomonas sp. 28-62-20 TaxID=1970433 RepID=UPI000A7A1D6C